MSELQNGYQPELLEKDVNELVNISTMPVTSDSILYEDEFTDIYIRNINSNYKRLIESSIAGYLGDGLHRQVLKAMMTIDSQISICESKPYLAERNRVRTLEALFNKKDHLNNVKARIIINRGETVLTTSKALLPDDSSIKTSKTLPIPESDLKKTIKNIDDEE